MPKTIPEIFGCLHQCPTASADITTHRFSNPKEDTEVHLFPKTHFYSCRRIWKLRSKILQETVFFCQTWQLKTNWNRSSLNHFDQFRWESFLPPLMCQHQIASDTAIQVMNTKLFHRCWCRSIGIIFPVCLFRLEISVCSRGSFRLLLWSCCLALYLHKYLISLEVYEIWEAVDHFDSRFCFIEPFVI